MRGTEFAFNIGHFLIILPFHSLLATFQVYNSLIFHLIFFEVIVLDETDPLSSCIILYIIGLEDGLESMKLQKYKKYICFESRKRTQKRAQKDMNELE